MPKGGKKGAKGDKSPGKEKKEEHKTPKEEASKEKPPKAEACKAAEKVVDPASVAKVKEKTDKDANVKPAEPKGEAIVAEPCKTETTVISYPDPNAEPCTELPVHVAEPDPKFKSQTEKEEPGAAIVAEPCKTEITVISYPDPNAEPCTELPVIVAEPDPKYMKEQPKEDAIAAEACKTEISFKPSPDTEAEPCFDIPVRVADPEYKPEVEKKEVRETESCRTVIVTQDASEVAQGDMSGKGGARGLQSSLTWMADEQRIHETADYGENHQAVSDALSDQKKRNVLVGDYKPQLQATARGQKKEDAESLNLAYDGLSRVSEKRLGCLEDIAQIASLEDLFGALSVEFAQRATSLVASEVQKRTDVPDKDGEGVACAAQNCVLAVRRNWAWISKLVRCADIHLRHVTDYHQFFHEVTEYTQWMTIELRKAQDKLGNRPEGSGDQKEAEQLLSELKELLTLFLHWQHKLDDLFERSRKVVPVHLRTEKLNYYRPVSCLCDYRTKEIFLREGEEVTLTDNSQAQSWEVRNMLNTTSNVPSVILVIPGPDPAAVEAACRLRLQLLGLWTLNVKRVGKTLIYFLVLVVKDWDKNEGRWIKSMTPEQKADVRRALAYIATVLGPYWSKYPGYQELDRRVKGTYALLDQHGKPGDRNEQASGALVTKLHTSEDLLKAFGELWRHWDSWRLLVDTSRHPDYLLMIDGWEKLKFMDIEKLRELWQKGLDFSTEDMEEWYKLVQTLLITSTTEEETVDGGMTETIVEETITATETATVSTELNGMENGSTSLESRRETAETGQILHAEQEEKKTFVITGVIDPRTNEEVSMQEAVLLGIINSNKGTYNNPDNPGESMPIPTAMSAGKIKVEFTTTRKTKEKRRDIGLITIKTEQESRPYTVKGVINAKTDEHLTVEEAVAAGILDQNKGIYKNFLTESEMSMADALDSGLLDVEFDKNSQASEPVVVTRTYAIHSVVDQRRKTRVTFTDAIRSGLLDKDTGAYYHNINREHIYVGDAIRRGFIKATVVSDASKLDIDPENKMVVDKVETIKKKLITPMVAIQALRNAAQSNGK